MSARKRISGLPTSVEEFDRHREQFAAWLLEHGSEICAPTNPYEVIRFLGPLAVCVVYRKESGRLTHWANGADVAYRAFLDKTDWRAVQRGQRGRREVNLIRSLAQRDGWRCCYCPTLLTLETATVEHFVSVTAGGTNHLTNLSLACGPCNEKAGHKPVREKIEMAKKNRWL